MIMTGKNCIARCCHCCWRHQQAPDSRAADSEQRGSDSVGGISAWGGEPQYQWNRTVLLAIERDGSDSDTYIESDHNSDTYVDSDSDSDSDSHTNSDRFRVDFDAGACRGAGRSVQCDFNSKLQPDPFLDGPRLANSVSL